MAGNSVEINYDTTEEYRERVSKSGAICVSHRKSACNTNSPVRSLPLQYLSTFRLVNLLELVEVVILRLLPVFKPRLSQELVVLRCPLS